MSKDWTSVRVTEDAKDDATEAKREDETWSDYIRRCAGEDALTASIPTDEIRAAVAEATGDGSVDEAALADAIAERLTVDVGDVTLEASERTKIAREVGEVLQG